MECMGGPEEEELCLPIEEIELQLVLHPRNLCLHPLVKVTLTTTLNFTGVRGVPGETKESGVFILTLPHLRVGNVPQARAGL